MVNMKIDVNRMFEDRDWSSESDKPDSFGVFIPGKRGRIFSAVNCPGGGGPYPTIVICHGLPGNEQMTDFAMTLRQAGFCTITFHYGGSWGSDGDFSLGGCMEDIQSVLDFVAKNEQKHFDTNNVFLIGHSMGGMLGVHAAATCEIIKAGVVIMPADIGTMYLKSTNLVGADDSFPSVIAEFARWLKGFSWESMAEEVAANVDKFKLCTYAEALSEKPLLTIRGTYDTDLPPKENIDVLNAAIKGYGHHYLTALSFPTNHGMSDQRYGIVKAIAAFLGANIR